MDSLLTYIGYIGVIIQFLVVASAPILLLWLIYKGAIKPLIELFDKKNN